MNKRRAGLVLLLMLASSGSAVSASQAHYLANEGVMVVHEETKILFDPLFRNSFGQYQLVPRPMEDALFAGREPFDGVDAIFVSHYHGDHFSPADVYRLLLAQPDIRLFAPRQAVEALRGAADDQASSVFERITEIDLDYRQKPVTMQMDGLLIEAVRIPHSGWPKTRLAVENISWRVTLDGTTTVVHMGDADPNDVHFSGDAVYWNQTDIHMAFPPYWFFMNQSGRKILEERLKPGKSVGVHVPVNIPADPLRRPVELRGFDLFTRPGETRNIPTKIPH